MSKQKQHPLLFLVTIGTMTLILLIVLFINPILYFFILLATVGWNIGLRNRKKREYSSQPNSSSNSTNEYITIIDEMLGKS